VIETEYDVIVAGYGPVGETCANLLGYYGIKALILDKEKEAYPLPRAITWDAECQRAMAHCDFSTKVKTRKIRGVDNQDANKKSILKITMDGFDTYNYQHSLLFIHQPQFDEAHRENAKKYKTNTIKTGNEILSITQSDGTVGCTYKDINTGQEFKTNSKYLLACDGANSTVRKLKNIELKSLDADETWMVVDGYTKNSFDCFTNVDAIQYCNPSRPTTIIQGVENCFRFEIAFMRGDSIDEIQKEEVFKKYIDQWLGDNEVEFSRTAVYSFHAANAEKWSDKNVFLLGDAAHQMPPFMGQGMNSGCRDAENLLWKINGVLKGLYSEKILHTYETERRPHVARITRGAIKMGGIINAKSKIIAFIRNTLLRTQSYFKGKENVFPVLNGNRLGSGVHKMPKIKNVSIERYYFNEINVRLRDGRVVSTDKVLEKNFGIILNNFNGNKKISEKNLDLINKHNFKIINITDSYDHSNCKGYIACEETHSDMEIYCDKYECNGVILRPDKYVFDLLHFKSNDSLEIIINEVFDNIREKIEFN
tara:strand:+ start:52 stop:1662 length:1611 start_codon:yes stop_codon:yes gene_type:complete